MLQFDSSINVVAVICVVVLFCVYVSDAPLLDDDKLMAMFSQYGVKERRRRRILRLYSKGEVSDEEIIAMITNQDTTQDGKYHCYTAIKFIS